MGCYMEGHVVNECLILRGIGSSNIAHILVGKMGGVVQVVSTMLFHGPMQYHAFPNNHGGQSTKY
jgi:hypothetical protein